MQIIDLTKPRTIEFFHQWSIELLKWNHHYQKQHAKKHIVPCWVRSVSRRMVQHRQHLTLLPASTEPMMRAQFEAWASASPNSWAIGIVPKLKSVALPTSCRTHSYAAQVHLFWITIMGTRLIVFAAILAAAWGNHGHHGNHHSLHSSITHQQPLISSFSHKLPGTNSYMSVTRYFNSRPSVDDGQLLLHQENQSQRQGHAVQDNGFHPWNPRFQVLTKIKHF